MTNKISQYGKKAFDIATKDMREDFNRKVLEATYKAQKQYGFEIGTGKEATHNNASDAFKHAYLSWYLKHHYGQNTAKWLGDMHEDETPNAPNYERNMDLWNNQIGREVSDEMREELDPFQLYDERLLSDVATKKIIEKMENGELITNPYKDKRQYKNMEKERLKDEDRVFYEDEYWDDMDDDERLRFKGHYANYKTKIKGKFPSKAELQAKTLKGDYIYVNNYTRSDGTKVNGYYRRRIKY